MVLLFLCSFLCPLPSPASLCRPLSLFTCGFSAAPKLALALVFGRDQTSASGSLACRLLLLHCQSTQLFTVSLLNSQERIWWFIWGHVSTGPISYAQKWSVEQVEIETLLLPLHLTAEMLELGVYGVAGVYVVWTLGETLLG